MTSSELKDLVVEDLVDSNFKPGEHEAYAYIMDRYKELGEGRVGSAFQRMLNELDWDEIEDIVKELNPIDE